VICEDAPSMHWSEMLSMGKWRLICVTMSVGLSLTACTAANSAVHILRAEQALQKAKGFEAEQFAPYQFTMSEEYLKKARSEAADSDHKSSVDLSKKAELWADQAIIAIENKGMQSLEFGGDEMLPEASDDLLPEAGELDLLGDEEL
jgi:hypothetical protein